MCVSMVKGVTKRGSFLDMAKLSGSRRFRFSGFLLGVALCIAINAYVERVLLRMHAISDASHGVSGTATSGRLFSMDREITSGMIDDYVHAAWQPDGHGDHSDGQDHDECTVSLIGVVTTVLSNPKVHDIFRDFLASYEDAQLVVVLDEGFNATSFSSTFIEHPRVHILDVDAQQDMYPDLSDQMPYKSFSRKNVGYLHAISLGACYIWDFDDDNDGSSVSLLQGIVDPVETSSASQSPLGCLSSLSDAVNPYLVFGPEQYVWPRGYPIPLTKTKEFPFLSVSGDCGDGTVDVIQILQEIDPDVDALWRLQNTLPLRWHVPTVLQDGSIIAIDPKKFAPFNAQSTIVSRKAFWSLYLPFTVHGRVSDIWRSYLMQAVSPRTGSLVAFSQPSVAHYRNTHNYLADFQAEEPLYERSGELLRFLSTTMTQLIPEQGDALDALVAVYAAVGLNGLFDGNFEKEMAGINAWTKELRRAYNAPKLKKSIHTPYPIEDTTKTVQEFQELTKNVLQIVHINHGLISNIPLIQAMTPEYAHTVYYTPGVDNCVQISGLPVNCISSDRTGWYSYESTFHAYKKNPMFEKYVFTHDDAIVKLSSLRKFLEGDAFQIADGKNHPLFESTMSNISDRWLWNEKLVESMNILKGQNWAPTCIHDNSEIQWRRGQVDFYVASKEAIEIALPDAMTLRWANTFLENALPTVVYTCIEKVNTYALYSTWDDTREDPIRLVNQFCGLEEDVVHPVKISSKPGFQAYLKAKSC